LLVGAGLGGLVSSIHWTIWFALPLYALRWHCHGNRVWQVGPRRARLAA
jgi:hypothetical protein